MGPMPTLHLPPPHCIQKLSPLTPHRISAFDFVLQTQSRYTNHNMKLIIINGPSGVGKSTVAVQLHKDIPLSLLIDIDAWRRNISGYREHREESLALAYQFTISVVDSYLKSGNSVIIDKAILGNNSMLDALVTLGKQHNAEIYEFVLFADKEKVLARADERGFRAESLLTREKVEELWEKASKLMDERPDAVSIETNNIHQDDVYRTVKKIAFEH